MREQLKAYIDHLFIDTQHSQEEQDFHDELLQNTLDRFGEERTNGKSEQEAYRIAVLSLGNTEELLKPFYPKQRGTKARRTIAIILYITSIVPVILFGAMDLPFTTLGVTVMFLMIAIATMLMILSGRAKPTAEAERTRFLRALGVAFIIGSIGAVTFGAGYENVRIVRLMPVSGAILGVCAMFCMIAGGIALIVTAGQKDHARTVPQVPVSDNSNTMKTDPETTQMRPAIPTWLRVMGGILTAIYWVITVLYYISASISSGAWYYTWLIFVFAGGIYDILVGIVRMCCGLKGLEMVLNGILGLIAGYVYYLWTERTGLWTVTWLIFPIAACIRGIIKNIFRLSRTVGKETN